MSTKNVLAAGTVIAVLLIAYYFLSPILALRTLANAARTGDRDMIALAVDFPALRENLKSQLNAYIVKKSASDPDLKDNPFAGFAMMLVPMVVDKIIDNVVTPDGIATIINKPARAEHDGSGIPALWKGDFSFLDSDHFKVVYTPAEEPKAPLGLVLKREGLFTWKLERLSIPIDELAANAATHPDNSSAPAAPTPSAPESPPASALPGEPVPQQGEQVTATEPTPAQPPVIAHPSFDCSASRTEAERLVCSNPELAGLDVEVAALYRAARASASDPSVIVTDQRQWVDERNQCGSAACLADVYNRRKAELAQWVGPNP